MNAMALTFIVVMLGLVLNRLVWKPNAPLLKRYRFWLYGSGALYLILVFFLTLYRNSSSQTLLWVVLIPVAIAAVCGVLIRVNRAKDSHQRFSIENSENGQPLMTIATFLYWMVFSKIWDCLGLVSDQQKSANKVRIIFLSTGNNPYFSFFENSIWISNLRGVGANVSFRRLHARRRDCGITDDV